MNKPIIIIIVLLYHLSANAQFMKSTAPIAPKKEHWRTIHGDRVPDYYYWMYDYFGKGPDSNQVIAHLKAENAYLEQVMSPSKKFRADLFNEMKSRIKEKDESVPVFKNGYFYYTRTEVGKQYYKYCRKKGNLDAKEEILLDVDQMAEGHAYFAASGFAVSEDNQKLAFGVDKVSRRQYEIRVKDLNTGQLLPDVIENTQGDPVWASDNKTIFYTTKNPVTLLWPASRAQGLARRMAVRRVV